MKKARDEKVVENAVFLALCSLWVKQFHQYISAHHAGMVRNCDFPKLLELYDESKPIAEAIQSRAIDAVPLVIVDTATGESSLTICGVEVPHELTLT